MIRPTHIWDAWERDWFRGHPDMILTVPACGAMRNATRDQKRPYLVLPEQMLERGTSKHIDCELCATINADLPAGPVVVMDWEVDYNEVFADV